MLAGAMSVEPLRNVVRHWAYSSKRALKGKFYVGLVEESNDAP
jgi:hypothetical protein